MLDGLFQPIHLLLLTFIAVFVIVVPYWKIFKKAGFNPLLSTLMLIPLLNIVLSYYLAFARWPNVPDSK